MATPPDPDAISAPAPDKETSGNVNRDMAKGAVWMVAMRLSIRFIGIISTVILARLLVPADFGLVAMAMMIYGFIEVMSQFSFDVVLIQKQDAGRDYYDTAWTLSILRGVITALLLYLGAESVAAYFGDERLVEIIHVLCLVAIVRSSINIGIVDFRKSMTFGKDFQYMVSVKIAAFVVTIFFAFLLRSYQALVIGIAISTLIELGLSYFMHPFRPRLSMSRWREIMNFSQWLVLNNILVFINLRGDSFIVGKILGAATLGVYTLAFEIATIATSELVTPIRRALFPGYSKLAHDTASLRQSFLLGFALILMFASPIAIGIGLVADPVVKLLLGEKWLEVIPLLQIMALIGLIQICSGNIGPLVLAAGRPRVVMFITAFSVSMGIPFAIFGTLHAGVIGTACALVVSNSASAAVWLSVGMRVTQTRLLTFLGAIWRSLVSLIAMLVAVIAVQGASIVVDNPEQLLQILIFEVLVGAVTYAGVHTLLWRWSGKPDGPEQVVLAAITQKFPMLAKIFQT